MVVRVFDACDVCDDDDCNGSCSTSTTDNTKTASCSSSHITHPDPSEMIGSLSPSNLRISCKNFIGNFKEFRIESNKSDLIIIGNGNRIKIIHNYGKLSIIGNNTRLKITHNSGKVKYTGNDGRIYLGSDSTQQKVDYTGCNGILKVINSMDINTRCRMQQKSKSNTRDTKKTHPTNAVKTCANIEENKGAHWQIFADLFQSQSAKSSSCSLPNLVLRCCKCGYLCKNSNVQMKSIDLISKAKQTL